MKRTILTLQHGVGTGHAWKMVVLEQRLFRPDRVRTFVGGPGEWYRHPDGQPVSSTIERLALSYLFVQARHANELEELLDPERCE